MEEQFTVSDGSNDRDYFTIIPNYILNHSTIYDRSLYITLKRIVGEKGTCWMTTRNLAEKTGMSAGQVSKSLKYLLDKGWIQQIGKRDGKTKPINEYRIVDIWHLNSEYYRKKESSPSEFRKFTR